MNFNISQIMVIVKDYNEAKDYYTNKLGFVVAEDTLLSNGKRQISVKPNLLSNIAIVLNKATNEAQIQAVGNQTGGKVLLVLHTSDIEADVKKLQNNSVVFQQDITLLPHGKVAIFKDLYGNLFDLVQPT